MKKGNSLESLAPKFNSFIKYEEYNLNPSQKAWNKLKYDYTQMYNPHDKFHLEKNFKDEYNLHNDEETVGDNQYFESKKDDEFYSKSRLERVKIIAKEKLNAIVSFYTNFSVYILLLFVYNYLNTKKNLNF